MYNADMEKIQRKYKNKKQSPLRSIKLYCKEQCSAGYQESWKDCTFVNCFLHRYRLGKGNRAIQQKQVKNHAISLVGNGNKGILQDSSIQKQLNVQISKINTQEGKNGNN